jgi:hypothetical protein
MSYTLIFNVIAFKFFDILSSVHVSIEAVVTAGIQQTAEARTTSSPAC